MSRLDPGRCIVHRTDDGIPIERIVISNGRLSVALLSWGCILQDLRLAGIPHPLTVGTDRIDAYFGPMRYFGALVGPVANRITQGRAVLNGKAFEFERNENGQTTLHSGADGTHARVWEIGEVSETSVTFETSLRDGLGGFPGNRVLAARFLLPEPEILEMRVTATSDADTWISFANHSFWNLDGAADLTGHRLRIAADRICETDDTALVTGKIRKTAGTGFDFQTARRLSQTDSVVLDHNFCLSDHRRPLTEVLTLTGRNGVSMTLSTTEPGLQIYDARGFDAQGIRSLSGHRIGPYFGLAIEAQGWPDAPNQRHFPSIVLKKGHAVEQVTRWHFAAPGT